MQDNIINSNITLTSDQLEQLQLAKAAKMTAKQKLVDALKQLVTEIESEPVSNIENTIKLDGCVSMQIDVSADENGIVFAKAWDGKDDDFEFYVVMSPAYPIDNSNRNVNIF